MVDDPPKIDGRHTKIFKNKFISLGQIPYYDENQNNYRFIDGFSKKIYSRQLLYSSKLDWTNIEEDKRKTVINIFNKKIEIIESNNINIYEIYDCNSKKSLFVEKDSYIGKDYWIDNTSGCKIFIFSIDNDVLFFFSDVFKYSTKNIEINESFRKELGVFFGIAYGRLYRTSCFGTPYYSGGNKLAEKIFMCLLKEVSNYFERLSLFLMKFNDDINIFYNPCIDEISHELFGHWQNSYEEDKSYYWQLISECYNYADNHLGSILKKLDRSDVISISSDHGICAVDTSFYINSYFLKKNIISIKDDKVDINNSKLFYHSSNTGALFSLVPKFKNLVFLKELKSLTFNNRKVIKKIIIFKKRTVFGDYYIIPEKGIYLDPSFKDVIFESTNKIGCHTINTEDEFLKAIFFVNTKLKSKNIKNTHMIKILKKIVRSKLC